MKKWIAIVVVLAAGGGAAWYWHPWSRAGATGGYRTVKVERGDLVQTVRRSGLVQPIKLVQVGTQVNGPITKLYVDYNSRVKAGDLVAQIDPRVYDARLAQDQANLLQAQANVEQTRAKLVQAEKDLVRAQELTKRDMLSQSELDAAVANRDVLAAQLKVSQASVALGEASLQLSKANLEYTTIRSPVDGVVISRNVSEGQTVVASMSAQTLFTATDLAKVQVEASIPEADIGKIRTNQTVAFTVDAYDDEFHGIVSQIRMAASTVQNVVTYPVVILADNEGEKLFPGMTADLQCEVARHTDVLKVANAAMRFKPAGAEGASGFGGRPGGGSNHVAGASGGGRPGAEGAGGRGGGGEEGRHGRTKLWIQKDPDGPLEPVRVKLGLTDGASTELEAEGLEAGQEIVVGLADGAAAKSSTVNPFVPQMPGGRSRGGTHPH